MPGHELIGDAEREAVVDIFDRGGVLYPRGFDERRDGRYLVSEFEEAVTERFDVEHALFVSSGTAALKLALIGLGVRAGDEVITQSHTFVATVEAALELGAEPVIVDVDETLNMDPTDLEDKISDETAAIVPVHMYGVAAEMGPVMEVAARHGVPVLEDSAWGFGSTLNGSPLGTIGDAGVFSFNFGKTITTGEGGMVVTDDKTVFQAAKEYANHGHKDVKDLPPGQDRRDRWGFNYKTSEVQAAIGLAQFEKLDTILERHRKSKRRHQAALSDVDVKYRHRPNPDGESCRGLTLLLEDRETAGELADNLDEAGIGTLNLPSAIKWHFTGEWDHIFDGSQEALAERWAQSHDLMRRSVVIPMSTTISEEDVRTVERLVRDVCG